MALKRRGGNDSKGSDSKSTIVAENLKAGEEYEGRLVYVADLGLHENNYKGDVKPDVQKIALGVEIIGETIEVDGEKKPRILWTKPFNIFYKMTEKGNELKYYKMFNPSAEENTVADWDSVLGNVVSVLISHTTAKDDANIVYDNIQSLSSVPKKYQADVGEALTEPCIGDADDEENACTKALYGLTRWFYDRRIIDGSKKEETPEPPNEPVFNPDTDVIPPF